MSRPRTLTVTISKRLILPQFRCKYETTLPHDIHESTQNDPSSLLTMFRYQLVYFQWHKDTNKLSVYSIPYEYSKCPSHDNLDF